MSYGKKIFSALGVIVIFLIFIEREIIIYGISQGIGQVKIIANAKPVQEILDDPVFPDSLKNKIRLVQEIRQYAFDSLGLNNSDNYTSVYDQKGKPILWIVTATEPFALIAKEWKFPILGSFSYKGFFDYSKAVSEAEKLKKDGYDTSIDEVGGWSTLGWFKDPILTNMLERSNGSLANLIIHELTHGTLYVKDNVDFNENLASFVGDKGAEKFLKYRYGEDSEDYVKYVNGRLYSKQYTQLVLKFSSRLDSLYKSFTDSYSYEQKLDYKAKMLEVFKAELLNFFEKSGYKTSKKKAGLDNLNNTYFMDVKRYREDLGIFEKEFKEKFGSDFPRYMKYLKAKYPSL